MTSQEQLVFLTEKISALLGADPTFELGQFLADWHPADIADVLDALEEDERLIIFSLLDLPTAADVLDETQDEATLDLIEAVPDERLADILEVMPMDDAAELLADLPPETSEALINLMEPEDAAEVQSLLAYPDETAGRLMTEKVVRVRSRWSAQQTIEHLRTVDPETETFAYLYVVNDEDCLNGVVPLRRLLTTPPDTPLSELTDLQVISVSVDTDQEIVADLVAKYDYGAIPVVDHKDRLVGIITHDDVVDILEQEATEDIQRLAGSQPLEKPYLSVGVVTMARKRIGWLLMLLLTATLTSTVVKLFEADLAQVAALTLFVPMLIGTGGNAGSQTTATVIRALGVGEIAPQDALRVLWHEVRTSVLLSLVMALAAFGYALLWNNSQTSGYELALAVSLSIAAILFWAMSMGSVLPLAAARLGIDPTVVSGPMMSTLVDATGLYIYFSIARAVLRL